MGALTAVGSRRSTGPTIPFSGLFPAHGRSDWPRGVQEQDLPSFALEHADALRPGHDAPRADLPSDDSGDESGTEIIDLFNRPIGSANQR